MRLRGRWAHRFSCRRALWALIVPLGNFLAGSLVGGRGIRFIAGLTSAAFLAGAIAAPPFYASHDVVTVTICAAVFALS